MKNIVHYDETGVTITLQFDDAADTRITYVEGTGSKLGRYEITKQQVIDAELAPDWYSPTVRKDAGGGEEIVSAFSFHWNGLDEASIDSGGGVISARIGVASLTPDEYLEIVQGEQKKITFIVEAKGRFKNAVAEEIIVKFRDPAKVVQTVEGDFIERITQELDIQVFRAILTAEQTAAMLSGLSMIEISFDDQKTVLTHSVVVLEGIAEE